MHENALRHNLTMEMTKVNVVYTENNHYKWGWGESNDWFNPPAENSKFKVTFGRIGRTPKSFREECILSAKRIADNAPGKIFVGLSGGSDSQTVCLSFLENKIEFTPCIMLMKQGMNMHDVRGAFQFCYRYGLKPTIHIIDLVDFYTKYATRYAAEYRFSNPRTMMQLWLQEQVGRDNTFIMGGGDPQLTRYKEADGSLTPLVWRFKPTPILQYLVQNGLSGTTKFFMYSPELIASIITHPFVKAFAGAQDAVFDRSFVESVHNWKVYNFTIKPMIYKENWPELISRPKFTGFEKVEAEGPLRTLAEESVAPAKQFNANKSIDIPVTDLFDYFSFPTADWPRVWYSRLVEQAGEIGGKASTSHDTAKAA